MEKKIEWRKKQQLAAKMSSMELQYAIKDCVATAKAGVDEGYYHDEASIYRQELKRR